MDEKQILCIFFVVAFVLAFLSTLLKWIRHNASMTESVENTVKVFQYTFLVLAVIILLGIIIAY